MRSESRRSPGRGYARVGRGTWRRTRPRGGLLVFDVITSDGPPLDSKGWSSGDDWAILYSASEDRKAQRLTRSIETFRMSGEGYRRGREVHMVKLFDERSLRSWLEDEGFEVETSRGYGEQPLGPGRLVFLATLR